MGSSTLDKSMFVGFDLGSTKMQASIYDEWFKRLGRERKKTKPREGSKVGIANIIETIKQALINAKIEAKDVAAIGFSIPGTLNLNTGIALDLPNFGWKDLHISSILKQEFGCPVMLINDVDAGTYGEYRLGAGKGARCLLGVFVGTGIGGACVYEGKLLRGRVGSCMEIGHIQMVPYGPLCGCGQRGCLETLAGRLAISSQAATAAFRGDAPHLLENIGMDVGKIRSSSLKASIDAGDEVLEQIVKDSAEWLGVAISSAVHLLAPDMVVLGGGLIDTMPDLLVKEIEKAARARSMPAFQNTFKVLAAKLGDEAASLGAAAFAMDMLKEDNKGK